MDSPTQLTVTRQYGGTASTTLEIGDIAILNSTPRNEDSDVGDAIKHESQIDFNYTEIFDEVELFNTDRGRWWAHGASA